jgi:hypothetical protein
MATIIVATIASICAKYLISQEQFDLATKVIATGRKAFYIVESLSTPGQEYRVEWNDEHHCLQCLPHNGEACPASKNGVPCWHKRCAMANKEHFKAEQAARRQREQVEAESDPSYEIEHLFAELDRIFEKLDEIAAESDRKAQAYRDAERNRYLNYELSMGI